MLNTSGALYIVSTPIGNLSDITLRAIEILKFVDIIAAEDTRHSRRLLDHYGIHTKLISIHQHNESQKVDFVKQSLAGGKNIALISDAGTPLISDPGYRLVSALKRTDYAVYTVPGPSALIAALSISGIETDTFYFAGFLSSKSAARKDHLKRLMVLNTTVILYEAPHRLLKTLTDIALVFGPNRTVCLARELTKKFETVKALGADDLLDWVKSDPQQLKGECVLIIAPNESDKKAVQELDVKTQELLLNMAGHLPAKVAAGIVSEFSGIPKNVLYRHLLEFKQ